MVDHRERAVVGDFREKEEVVVTHPETVEAVIYQKGLVVVVNLEALAI